MHKYSLDNGITVVEDQVNDSQSFTLMIMFRTGSRNETQDIWGISHFLEHMAFKGTKSYPSAALLAKELDSLGAIYNAFTSKEHTAYYIKGSKNVFDKALSIFSEMATCPVIIDEEVDKERGTIIEELNMYEDDPRSKLGDYYENSLYPDRQLSQEIIGTKESLHGIHAKEILDYRKHFYLGENTVIAISGYVPAGVQEKLEQLFSDIQAGSEPNLAPTIEKKKPMNLLTRETQQTHLAVGFPALRFSDADRPAAAVLSAILGGNMSSRMFSEVREKRGLAYYVRTHNDSMLDTGTLVTVAGVNNAKAQEAVKVIKEVYQSVLELVSDDELRRTKDFMIGMMTLSYEDSETRSESAATAVMYGEKPKTLSEKISSIEKVTANDVQEMAKRIIDFDKVCLALIGPFSDEEIFAKILQTNNK
jgi:predicted Zn-dependent peptidase